MSFLPRSSASLWTHPCRIAASMELRRTRTAPAINHYNGSEWSKSIFTTCTALIPTYRLKRRSARWQSWCVPGKCATSGSPRLLRRRCAAPHKIHPIAAVQTEYSLFSREPEDGLIPVVHELGIALVAYSPLGRGFLGGRFRSVDDLASDDWRRGNPRFQGEQFATNLSIADRLREIAEEKDCTPAQLALAWLLHRHQNVIPIPGTSSMARLEENIHAASIRLSDEDLNRIEHALPKGAVAGERYAPAMMQIVNG